jgi:hypothetical protein
VGIISTGYHHPYSPGEPVLFASVHLNASESDSQKTLLAIGRLRELARSALSASRDATLLHRCTLRINVTLVKRETILASSSWEETEEDPCEFNGGIAIGITFDFINGSQHQFRLSHVAFLFFPLFPFSFFFLPFYYATRNASDGRSNGSNVNEPFEIKPATAR